MLASSGAGVKKLHTTELFFKEKAEIGPSPGVHKQFCKAESPALHPHFGRGLNTVWTKHTIFNQMFN